MKDEGGKRTPEDLRVRTKQFALRVIRLYQALPRRDGAAQVLGKQLLRSGTSVAAHYREASRAKSNLDFVSKLESALQELDETDLWIELLGESGVSENGSCHIIACGDESTDRNLSHHGQESKSTSALNSSVRLYPSSLTSAGNNPNRR
jgi:four helix bundle protein